MDLTPSVDRLDRLCNIFAGIARDAAANGWPEQLMHAARHLAHELEEIAGTLDTAGDASALRAAVARGRETLPLAFEIFGRAIAENLMAGARA